MKRRREVGLVLAAVFGVFLWWCLQEDYGVRVASVRWLPPAATNITYIRNDLNQIAEFDIEQKAFERWCANRGMPLRRLADAEQQTLDRCLWILEERGVIPIDPEPNEAEAYFKELEAGDLFSKERWSNGGATSIGYDIDERRGYYESSRH